jgi:hypothetical protein
VAATNVVANGIVMLAALEHRSHIHASSCMDCTLAWDVECHQWGMFVGFDGRVSGGLRPDSEADSVPRDKSTHRLIGPDAAGTRAGNAGRTEPNDGRTVRVRPIRAGGVLAGTVTSSLIAPSSETNKSEQTNTCGPSVRATGTCRTPAPHSPGMPAP